MPQVLAALVRSAPSRTIASANIRRDAALFFSRPAATRSSMAVKSLWVTAIAAIVLAPLHTKSPSIQTFSDSGIPHESSILAVGITRFEFSLSHRVEHCIPLNAGIQHAVLSDTISGSLPRKSGLLPNKSGNFQRAEELLNSGRGDIWPNARSPPTVGFLVMLHNYLLAASRMIISSVEATSPKLMQKLISVALCSLSL